jgi:hypothetical protein
MSRPDEKAGQGPLLRAFIAALRAVVTGAVLLYHLLAVLFAPVLRPLWRWLSGLRLFQIIGTWIGRQHPYVVLILLGVPFVAIEPAKYLAVIWGVLGHPVEGTIALIVAEVLSLLICDRIFHAGHERLMRIAWFRRMMEWLIGLRDRALAWTRSTAAWRWSREIWARVRQLFAR